MTNKEFDKIFRDKLSGHRTPVDGGMWHSIESSLSGGKSVPFGSLDRSGTAGKWRRAAAYVAAVAAVIVIAVLITTENDSSDSSTDTKVISVSFSSRRNPRLPILYGKLPYEEGIYSWHPKEEPVDDSLSMLEITIIVLASTISFNLFKEMFNKSVIFPIFIFLSIMR